VLCLKGQSNSTCAQVMSQSRRIRDFLLRFFLFVFFFDWMYHNLKLY